MKLRVQLAQSLIFFSGALSQCHHKRVSGFWQDLFLLNLSLMLTTCGGMLLVSNFCFATERAVLGKYDVSVIEIALNYDDSIIFPFFRIQSVENLTVWSKPKATTSNLLFELVKIRLKQRQEEDQLRSSPRLSFSSESTERRSCR